jgi:hypothetical protein
MRSTSCSHAMSCSTCMSTTDASKSPMHTTWAQHVFACVATSFSNGGLLPYIQLLQVLDRPPTELEHSAHRIAQVWRASIIDSAPANPNSVMAGVRAMSASWQFHWLLRCIGKLVLAIGFALGNLLLLLLLWRTMADYVGMTFWKSCALHRTRPILYLYSTCDTVCTTNTLPMPNTSCIAALHCIDVLVVLVDLRCCLDRASDCITTP